MLPQYVQEQLINVSKLDPLVKVRGTSKVRNVMIDDIIKSAMLLHPDCFTDKALHPENYLDSKFTHRKFADVSRDILHLHMPVFGSK